MVSFSTVDILIIVSFFISVLIIGMIPAFKKGDSDEGFLLSGRKVGLLLFILTNVSTWYGGILGVGEFTYRSGLLSWVTQGLPYYVFALLFAFLFAGKIRNASLFTIPDKLEKSYGSKVGILSALFIFILVSPAPYILMIGSLIKLIFDIELVWALIIAAIFSSVYLIKGGYKSDLYTDVLQFFIMFIGFIIIVVVSIKDVGGIEYLTNNLPKEHLQFSGGASSLYILVWFLIALWTFADPGFHQRCYAAKDGNTAKWGIIISVLFWLLFDFLTTTTGLFAKALLPDLSNPVLAFPLYAEKILGSGLKGIFYAALFATIISTANSFLFISGTTFGRDFVQKFKNRNSTIDLVMYVRIGIVVSVIISVILALTVQSVIGLWYLIGSFCLPGIIFLIFGAYYKKLAIDSTYAFAEIIAGSSGSIVWHFVREEFDIGSLSVIEPMLVGLLTALVVHLIGMLKRKEVAKRDDLLAN